MSKDKLNFDRDREALASLCHEQWSGWMKYMFDLSHKTDDGEMVIPHKLVERWTRQMNTPYAELSEPEQNSDRAEADRFMALMDTLYLDGYSAESEGGDVLDKS